MNLINLLKSNYVKGAHLSGVRLADDGDVISVYMLMEMYDTFERSTLKSPLELSGISLKQGPVNQLHKCIRRLRERCGRISAPKSMLRYLMDLLFETSLGSISLLGTLDQQRIDIEMHLVTKRIAVPISGKSTLDCMVILPIVENETARERDLRYRALEHSLEDRDANASRDNSLKQSNMGLRMNDSVVQTNSETPLSLVLMCMSDGPFESLNRDDATLKFFLTNNYYVFLWNYRGYGKSKGSVSLENMISDGERVVKFIRDKFTLKTTIVYGRHIGGHVAKSLSGLVDVVILDRTFSSLSLVSYYRWYSKIIDLFIDNYRINCRQLLDSESSKIVLYDPKMDARVKYLASLTFGLSVELVNVYFNKSNRTDLESNDYVYGVRRLVRRLYNMKFQREYHEKQIKMLDMYRLILSERDTNTLFLAIKRILKVCMARTQVDRIMKDSDLGASADIDLERMESEGNEDLLDEEALSNIHMAAGADGNKQTKDKQFDYSKLVHHQVDKDKCFKTIDKVLFV